MEPLVFFLSYALTLLINLTTFYKGLVTQVPTEFYDFLNSLESRLVSVIKSVGKIDHSFWRSFNTDMKTEPCENFIDGDLVESFLDLPRETMQKVCVGLQVNFKMVFFEAQVNFNSFLRETPLGVEPKQM